MGHAISVATGISKNTRKKFFALMEMVQLQCIWDL